MASNNATPANYRHSKAFEVLSNTKERIPNNLTSAQYLRMLDVYLQRCCAALIYNTHWLDVFMSKMLAWQAANPRRKLLMDRDANGPSKILEFLTATAPEEKLEKLIQMKPDRAVLFEAISTFLSLAQHYVDASNLDLPVPESHRHDPLAFFQLRMATVLCELRGSGTSLLATYHQVRHYEAKALEFRDMILEKYTRLCLVEAQKDYVSFFNCEVELDDIIQAYRICAQRAIDKCDSTKGVLTTHILNWLKTGKSKINKHRLEAIQRNKMSFDLFEEASDSEEVSSLALHIRSIARMADPTGVARMYLGIEEILPVGAVKLLRSFAVRT